MSYGLAAPLAASPASATGWQAGGNSPVTQPAQTYNIGYDNVSRDLRAQREVPTALPPPAGLPVRQTKADADAASNGTFAAAMVALGFAGTAFLAIPIVRTMMGSADKAAHNLHMESNVRDPLHLATQSGRDPAGVSAYEYVKNFASGETVQRLAEEIAPDETQHIHARKAQIESALREKRYAHVVNGRTESQPLSDAAIASKTHEKLHAEFADAKATVSHERMRKTAGHLQSILSKRSGIDDIRRAIDASIIRIGEANLEKLEDVSGLERGRGEEIHKLLTEFHQRAVDHVRKPVLKALEVIR